jgi:hypothetical protein
MPQLDKVAYGSEVIYLIFVFLGLYLIVLKKGLSYIYKILLYRQMTLELLVSNYLTLGNELFYHVKLIDQRVQPLKTLSIDEEAYNEANVSGKEMVLNEVFLPGLYIFENLVVSVYTLMLYKDESIYLKIGKKDRDNIIENG